MSEIQGSRHLITGVSSGIGEAVAKQLLDAGAAVFGVSRRRPTWCDQYETFYWIEADLLDKSSPTKISKFIARHTEHLDSIVNSAGILSTADISDETVEEWNNIITCNLTSCFFTVQACLPFLEKGTGKAVVNISSNAGRMGGISNSVSYAASKGALIAMTYSLSRKLAKLSIRVNCVAPGPTNTPLFNEFSAEKQQSVISTIPLSRIGTVAEVANSVLFLISKQASFITGATLDVNGGLFTG